MEPKLAFICDEEAELGRLAQPDNQYSAVVLIRLQRLSPCAIGAGNRYFPFVSDSVETANDLNGAPLPTVTTNSQYDGFGNATSVSVSTGDGHSKTTTNAYHPPDLSNWFLGRLKSSTVQSTMP